MKKVIFSAACVAAALTLQADWLSWCVSSADLLNSGIDDTDVGYMRVGYVNQGSQPTWSGQNLVSLTSDLDDSTAANGLVDYTGDGNAQFKVDMSSFSASSYGFYIELLNSSYEVVARTGDNKTFQYDTYEQLGNYISTGDIGDVPTIKVWHGTFEAVPEPSSMALLALGAGLVGLRRKLRKGKKGKRA